MSTKTMIELFVKYFIAGGAVLMVAALIFGTQQAVAGAIVGYLGAFAANYAIGRWWS